MASNSGPESFGTSMNRLLDVNDPKASASSEQAGITLLSPEQILANITTQMERFQLDPTVSIGLLDITDAESLYAFFQSGVVESGVTHIAAEAARILKNDYPGIFPELCEFDFLDTFDPRVAFEIPEGQFEFEPLGVTRAVMRDYLDPSRTPPTSYDISALSAKAVSAIMLGSLFAFSAISITCRAHRDRRG
jgi:hypothetical protein